MKMKAVVVEATGGVEVLQYKDHEAPTVASNVMDITDGKGCKLIIDGIGKDTYEISLQCLAKRGLFVSFGNASGAVPAFPVLRLLPQSAYMTRPNMKSVEKQSDVERAEGLEAFKKGVESDYSVPNADKTAKVDVTARVGGRVTLSLLNMKNDTKLSGESEGIVTKAVHAELKARNIKLTENEMNKLNLRGKVHRIRAHEFKELRTTRDLKQETDVSDVEPWSVEMKAFLNEKQDELLAAKGK